MTQSETIAQNIVKFRKQKGLTQNEVAEYLGITRAGYANYEQGSRAISFETALKLGELFGISTNTLGYVDTEDLNITPHEKKLIKAYRDNPDLQPAVDRLLLINDGPAQQSVIFRAASSKDNHSAEITTTTKDFSKIKQSDDDTI